MGVAHHQPEPVEHPRAPSPARVEPPRSRCPGDPAPETMAAAQVSIDTLGVISTITLTGSDSPSSYASPGIPASATDRPSNRRRR